MKKTLLTVFYATIVAALFLFACYGVNGLFKHEVIDGFLRGWFTCSAYWLTISVCDKYIKG